MRKLVGFFCFCKYAMIQFIHYVLLLTCTKNMSRLYLKNIKYLKHNSTIILEIKAAAFFYWQKTNRKRKTRNFFTMFLKKYAKHIQ